MALDYTVFFTVIGKYVKSLNTLFGKMSSIQTGLDDIEAQLEDKTLNRLAGNVHTTFERFKRDIERWTDDIIGEVRTVITDRDFVQEELVLEGSGFDEIIQEIIKDMNAQSETVQEAAKSAVSLATITGKTTVGIFYGINTLDAVTPPGINYPASKQYIGLTSELAMDDYNYYLECVSAGVDGQETLRWISEDPETQPYRDQAESPGVSSSFPLANSENLLGSESLFEDFVDNSGSFFVPIGWVLSGSGSPVPDTNYARFNVPFRGTYSLIIKLKDVTLTRDLDGLAPGKGYFATIRTSGNLVVDPPFNNTKVSTENDVITITVTGINKDGTSWSTAGSQDVNDPADPDWQYGGIFFVVPLNANVEPNATKIAFNCQPFDNADWMIIDEAVVSPARYFDGSAYSVVRGQLTDQLEVEDRTPVIAFSYGAVGTWQTFFRRAFGIQLPSDEVLSETIADSLAT